MKILPSLVSAIGLVAMLIFTGCDDDDVVAQEEIKPVAQIKASIDGQLFTSKVLIGRFYPEFQYIDIEGHETDSTSDNQYVLGIQIEYDEFNATGDYDFAEHEIVGDLIFYFFDREQKSYYPREGKLSIKKISATAFEATFSSLLLKSSYPDAPPITMTDGTIRVDLKETFD